MKWKVAPKKNDDIIEQILINRGIKTKEDREIFFNPKISDFEKDLKIPGIQNSLKRINQAIEKDELIVVFGDYDVDGISASAILYKALTSIGAKVLPYIPHREKEGYGLSKLGLDFAKESKATVVITVDNGIVAIEQAKYAKELGLDLIITDHHQPDKKLPEAFEIVHSTKMCGAAVAWCLIKDVVKKDLMEELLQFVAIATVCDLIPLIGIDRALVYEGLKVLNQTTNPGLLALINESGLRFESIGSFEIGYVLGPRINAIGRLEHAIDALRLLCTRDEIRAKSLAKLLHETNLRRQKMTIEAYEEAKLLVFKDKKIHVLSSKNWVPGLIGLIAGKITQEYSRPSIAISVGQTISKGSARSVDGVNIIKVIRQFSDILIDVGGHPGAAGFSIRTEHIEIFKTKIEKSLENLSHEIEEVLEIDAEIKTEQINFDLIKKLKAFEPLGYKNPRPIFATISVKVSDIKTVGEGKHLKFKVDNIDAIAFGMGELETSLQNGQQISVAYTPEINEYNRVEKLQLKVKDLKIG